MPVASRGEVLPLADGPAESSRVPEDVPVLVDVLEDWPLWGPLDGGPADHLVAAVAVSVGGAQDVDGRTD